MKTKLAVFLLTLLVQPPLAWSAPQHPARNPFQRQNTSAPPSSRTDTSPLERYPLSELRLTAIIADTRGDIFASVENPDGVGFKVDVGTRLGTSRAQVVEITRRGLLIAERTVNDMGTEETTMRELLLRKP